MKPEVASILSSYFSDVSQMLGRVPIDPVAEAAATLHIARMMQSRVYVFGNGGSAATASHFACDLAKGTILPGRPTIRVRSLVDSMPVFSAWANDHSYETVFARQLQGEIEQGDVAVAISGSGNSPNVLEGVRTASEAGATTIGLCGFDGGELAKLVDIAIHVPCQCMEQVEDAHLAVCHALAFCLRQLRSGLTTVTKNPEALQRMASRYLAGTATDSPETCQRRRPTYVYNGIVKRPSV